jgi:hypothetical protein
MGPEFQTRNFFQLFFGFFRLVPEFRGLCEFFFFLDLFNFLIDVKDASLTQARVRLDL